MTNQDMEQIRELLIGEFSKETKDRLDRLEAHIEEIQDENLKNIKNLSKSLTNKLNQVHKMSQNSHQNLEDLINRKIKEQKQLTSEEFQDINNQLDIQKDFTNESLNILKKSIKSNIKTLREDIINRSVSKESLSTIFLDYSLRLKDSNVEDELINEIADER
ncbi:hypothetical protein MNB_SV-9-807 [hydrothermal vent metagenome]|uniref:Uncharacterized protein n=1 Tax=hydrothermal vent metagenome TaxID=652676 RepID=A0A1W1C334_9ZZZZ